MRRPQLPRQHCLDKASAARACAAGATNPHTRSLFLVTAAAYEELALRALEGP